MSKMINQAILECYSAGSPTTATGAGAPRPGGGPTTESYTSVQTATGFGLVGDDPPGEGDTGLRGDNGTPKDEVYGNAAEGPLPSGQYLASGSNGIKSPSSSGIDPGPPRATQHPGREPDILRGQRVEADTPHDGPGRVPDAPTDPPDPAQLGAGADAVRGDRGVLRVLAARAQGAGAGAHDEGDEA